MHNEMIAIPRCIELKSKARMDNQSNEPESVMDIPELWATSI